MKQINNKSIINRLFIIIILSGIIQSFPLAATGSQESFEQEANTNEEETITYTDMLDRQITLKKDIQRIVILRTMDIHMLVPLLGEELDDKLIAVGTSFAEGDIDGYNKFSEMLNLDDFINLGSVYSDDGINPESVMLLNPDIVIVDAQFKEKASVNKMIDIGLPVVFTDINSDSFHGEQEALRMLGMMLGVGKRAGEIADYATEKVDSVLARIEKLEKEEIPVPKLYFECGNVPPSEIGGTRGDPDEGWGYLWKHLRSDNIGSENGRNPMNPEQVLVSNPDVIVIGGANWNPDGNIMRLGFFVTQESVSDHLNEYALRPGWQDLNAIKNGQLFAVHFNYFTRPYNFAGVEAMAQFLYPEEFQDLDPEGDMAEFFDRFMPVDYSGMFSGQWNP